MAGVLNGAAMRPEFRLGVRDTIPVALGVIPFGITYGIVGPTVGLTAGETLLMSLLVFAGAAQFVSTTMIGMGITDFSTIVFTTLLINLRHLLMGASLSPHMAGLPPANQLRRNLVRADHFEAAT
jgi:predicted branched-subunit amino acid permease